MSGKYIKLASNSDLASFAQLCDPSTLSTAFSKQDTGFVSAGTTTINGQPALAFKQPKNPSNGAVYVSQTATPQIVRIAGRPARGHRLHRLQRPRHDHRAARQRGRRRRQIGL